MIRSTEGDATFCLDGHNIATINRDKGRIDTKATHALYLEEHFIDCLGGAGKRVNNAFLHTTIFTFIVADDTKRTVWGDGRDYGADIFRANIYTCYISSVFVHNSFIIA